MIQERPSILLIVNPISGNKEKTTAIALATKLLASEFDLKIQYTTYKGHAFKLAQEAVEQHIQTVVAVGGDGTVNEVAKALIHTETSLGIIPVGSGNGLARDLGFAPPIHLKAIESIKKQKTKLIDYGMVNDTPFFCTCGIGFDAHISWLFSETEKRGFIKYAFLCLREFFRYNCLICEMEHDEKKETKKAFVINCANIRQLGNNAYIAPRADFQDGKMNVTILKPFRFWGAFYLAWCLFTKQIDKAKKTETFTCSELTLNIPENAPFHYDGEPMEVHNPVKIHIVKQGLKVIAPIRNLPI